MDGQARKTSHLISGRTMERTSMMPRAYDSMNWLADLKSYLRYFYFCGAREHVSREPQQQKCRGPDGRRETELIGWT
jgi:hypothetical protein